MKNIFSVRGVLGILLGVSILFAAVATYYKIKVWGFSAVPNEKTEVWTIDARISFKPTGKPIEISLSTPSINGGYKVLSEDVIATGYETVKDDEHNRMIIKSGPRKTKQNVYYRIMIYDNEYTRGKIREVQAPEVTKPQFENEQQQGLVEEIWALANKQEGTPPAQIIKTLNADILPPEVDAFLPVKTTRQILAEKVIYLLSYKGIPARIVRGVKLNEKKHLSSADLMLEAYENDKWMIYNLKTGEFGIPEDFVPFQRGGVSLLDVSGGTDSQVKFSVLKSSISSFNMAGRRAKYENSRLFDYTIYNLPTLEQNTLKWLMIFPLAILLVVIMRNVIGISTMGTFTPMLISMSLIKTGFISGLLCYGLIVILGLIIRTTLSRLNLLLVPRISAVVIFVILIMQVLTVIGYRYDFGIMLSAAFFPIIITAWIIERASITWEEEGAKNATKQIINTSVVALFTYFVISNKYILHFMYAFNEWNLVILFIVMLLGTYTGYRIVELKRFAPLIKDK